MTVMSPTRLRDPYFIYRYRHRLHVLRTSLALAITFIVILTLQIPHGSWALVSTMMVMGNLPHIGGVIDKGGATPSRHGAGSDLGHIAGADSRASTVGGTSLDLDRHRSRHAHHVRHALWL